MNKRVRTLTLVVGLAVLAASAFYCLHLVSTMLYVRAPWHNMVSSTSLPKDELALDLQCPAALTCGETAQIRLGITNLRPNELRIRVFGASGDLVAQSARKEIELTIAPSETAELDWQVTAEQPGGHRFSVFIHSPGSGVAFYSPGCLVPVFLAPRDGAALGAWVGLVGALCGSMLCAPWVYCWLRGHRPRRSRVVLAAILLLDGTILVSLLSYATVLSPT